MGNSAIHFHLYSGNAQDVTERLDKGLLDFGVLIQPADLSRYQSLQLKGKDQWGVLMPKDSPLAAKKAIYKKDLLDLPLICSRQAIARHISGNAFSDWFGEDFERLNIVGTFHLQCRPSGRSRGRLCHQPGRSDRHLQRQRPLLSASVSQTGIPACHCLEEGPGLFPCRAAFPGQDHKTL